MSSKEISIKIIEKRKTINNLSSNCLKFSLSGSEINYVVVNTIVRVGLSLVGSYAFNPEYISIERNTSIFNNNKMNLRLSNIPIINKNYEDPIVHNTDELIDKCLEYEHLANTSIFKMKKDNLQELEDINNKRKELLNNLHMHIEARNRTDEIINVTSNEKFTSFYLNDKKIPDIFPKEVLLIKLKPGEDFIATAVADYNIPLINNIYSSVSVLSSEEINDNEYHIYLESQRQIEEEEIIKKCCKIIINKLNHIQKIILDKLENINNDDAEYEEQINIENENHTLGNLLTRALQDHKNISFCGYKIDHPFINELAIKYKTEGNKFSNILKDVIKNQIKLFEKIASKL